MIWLTPGHRAPLKLWFSDCGRTPQKLLAESPIGGLQRLSTGRSSTWLGAQKPPDIVDVYEFLEMYENSFEFADSSVNISTLRERLYAEIARRQAHERAGFLEAQWRNVGKLPDNQPQYEVATTMLLQQVVSTQAALVLEGIATSALDRLEGQLRRALKTVESKTAERIEERRAQAVRSYQRWALSKIKDFEGSFKATAFKAAEAASILRRDDGGWKDEYYREVRRAMITDLLPISLPLLDLPVQERYHQAFQTGWKKLDGREDQTAVVQASALSVKKELRAFLEE